VTPVVLIAEELAPAALDVLADDFDVRHVDGTDRPALLAALADAHAVIVRSATQIDAEAVAAGPQLRVIARAGVGLDNIEVPAATARGVMVVNAPTSNIVSAAEQAIALLLTVARHTASASTALKAGEWKRSKYTGVEVQGKTVGVVGLGRIGVLFAQRMAAFGTRLRSGCAWSASRSCCGSRTSSPSISPRPPRRWA
jgi:D-3-phosphoglycerate dehydrogenase / 2-oxoglutarate reductase